MSQDTRKKISALDDLRPGDPNGFDVTAPFSVELVHRLRFCSDVLSPHNPLLAQTLGSENDPATTSPSQQGPIRVLVFVDQGVIDHWPVLEEQVEAYAKTYQKHLHLAAPVRAVPGGEACKNDRAIFDSVCRSIHDAGLCRRSAVVVIGGGAVMDTVGFAAAIAHRGIRLVRIPTTSLAQADAGVGVKNGINAFGKKNFLGTFSPPWAVINDETFLTTLSDRDWRCGLSEAVKVALVKDATLFDRIVTQTDRLVRRDLDTMAPIVRHSARLHLSHIVDGGDPFETSRARPLDFGHWLAHKLEQASGYRVRHGEAVAIGIAVDTIYSEMSGLLPQNEARVITDCLGRLGFALYDPALADTTTLLEGLEEFRQHLGGQLTVTLLKGIGMPIEVQRIDYGLMTTAIKRLVNRPVAAGVERV